MQKQKNSKFSKFIIMLAIINTTIFTVATFYVSLTGNLVPDSLVQCFFIFWGSEMISLAYIKKNKIKNNYENTFGGVLSGEDNTDEDVSEDISEDEE